MDQHPPALVARAKQTKRESGNSFVRGISVGCSEGAARRKRRVAAYRSHGGCGQVGNTAV